MGCNEEESQSHIFENCEPLRQSLRSQHKISINKIYGSVSDQKEAIVIFEQIDDQRKLMNINILPGGFVATTLEQLQTCLKCPRLGGTFIYLVMNNIPVFIH